MNSLAALLLVGVSVGLENFAASIAIGLGGVSKSLRLKIALIFGLFESGMPIVGLVIGQELAKRLGGHANLVGGELLMLSGIYVAYSALKKTDDNEVKHAEQGLAKLFIAGLALSIDNLIVGFGLGTNHEPLLLSALVIGAISVAMSLLGLEIGKRLSQKVEEYSELFGGIILFFVGVVIALNFL